MYRALCARYRYVAISSWLASPVDIHQPFERTGRSREITRWTINYVIGTGDIWRLQIITRTGSIKYEPIVVDETDGFEDKNLRPPEDSGVEISLAESAGAAVTTSGLELFLLVVSSRSHIFLPLYFTSPSAEDSTNASNESPFQKLFRLTEPRTYLWLINVCWFDLSYRCWLKTDIAELEDTHQWSAEAARKRQQESWKK
ncbi:hypothetical protein DFP73DRAFT_587356 [Morchella snyderi]|nr:hypothetical protein DFP73DRAFT_587356 [Morchella snyderi]